MSRRGREGDDVITLAMVGWTALVFRPDLLGGFKGQGILGPFPLFAAAGGGGAAWLALRDP